MARIKLKRLLKKKEAVLVIKNLIKMMDISIGIKDTSDQLLLGDDQADSTDKYPIELETEVLGWVIGGEKAAAIAFLLNHLASKEVEKKNLADEVLDRYREVNLLYNLSEKLGASLELQAVVQVALTEASRLIASTDGMVMLTNEATAILEVVSVFGQNDDLKESIELGQGIIGNIAQSGKAEIVNDVLSDARAYETDNKIRSLVCTPLKTEQKVVGVIFIGHKTPVTYTAADLKLLSTIASQAAPAIENALIYKKKLTEAKEREQKLQRQITEMRIELDEAKRQRQVVEIIDTDYFRELQVKAKELRESRKSPKE